MQESPAKGVLWDQDMWKHEKQFGGHLDWWRKQYTADENNAFLETVLVEMRAQKMTEWFQGRV